MRTIPQVLAGALVLCLAASVAACSSESPDSSESPVSPESAPSTGAPITEAVAVDATTAAPTTVPALTICESPRGESTEVTWTMDGGVRRALVHASAAVSESPPPVVVALHGNGGDGEQMETVSTLSQASDERGWLVVYPEGTGFPKSWAVDPAADGHAADIAFLRQVLADVAAGGCGDSARVIVTGMSLGGWLSDMAGCEMSDVVAGVVPVAGNDLGWPCQTDTAVAFASINGVVDDVVPYEGGQAYVGDTTLDVSPVDDWTTERAAQRGCQPVPEESAIFEHVSLAVWAGCTAPMSRYRVANGGHSWPSGGPSGFGLEPPTNQELSIPDVIASMIDALPPT